ncbi:MAG: hypothetical protein ACOC0D_07175 [Spirochaeta sp.]
MAQFLRQAREIVLPCVFTLWGTRWADVDGRGRLTVVLTPLINEQGRAIGFFNPNDLYPRNTDPLESGYNPVSNETAAVYLADPSRDPEVFAYSLPSLLATLAHEISHLINFSHKVVFREESGIADPRREALFLDEGLAHLTESLVGYGVSGGNLAFFSRYLDHTPAFSARMEDLDGAVDSTGKRGMMSAFLSWAFWREGGAVWDPVDPGLITDSGGIAFLRRLLNSGAVGWSNISGAVGTQADHLLLDWAAWIDRQDQGVVPREPIILDPVTKEALCISPFYGTLVLNGHEFPLNGPRRFDLQHDVVMTPYSLVFGQSLLMQKKGEVHIRGSSVAGYAAARFYMD